MLIFTFLNMSLKLIFLTILKDIKPYYERNICIIR